MAITVLVSGRGAPGVTTSVLALALSWPLRPDTGGAGEPGAQAQTRTRVPVRVLVVEADAAGSSIGPGFLRGTADPDKGLTSVLSAGRDQMSARMVANTVPLAEIANRHLLVGVAGPHQMAATQAAWADLARLLWAESCRPDATDVVVDFGRVGAAAEASAVLEVADLAMVVTRSSLPAVAGAVQAVRYLTSFRDYTGVRMRVGCVVVGDQRPYSRTQIAAVLGVPVWGVLAWDPASASVLGEGAVAGRGFWRGRLLRSAVAVADHLVDLAARSAPAISPESSRAVSVGEQVRYG